MEALKFEITGTEVGAGRKGPRWEIFNDINGEITFPQLLGFLQESLVQISKDVLQEELKKGFPKDYITITDGKVGKPIETVDPLRGQIQFVTKFTSIEIALEIYDTLLKLSRVRTGLYRQSHIVTYRGVQVANSRASLDAWIKSGVEITSGSVMRFINYTPYARKLELSGVSSKGRSTKTRLSKREKDRKKVTLVRRANGAYYLTSVLLRKKFPRTIGKFRFEFITGAELPGLPKIPGMRNTFIKDGRPYLYPTISITFDSTGVRK